MRIFSPKFPVGLAALILISLFAGQVYSGVPVDAIVLDGKEGDWASIGSNRWFDPIDAGGGSQDLVELRLASDADRLYLFLRFAAPYGNQPPPRIRFAIDRDGKQETGKDGYEARVEIEGAGRAPASKGAVKLTLFGNDGTPAAAKALGSPQPQAPDSGADFLEVSVPLRDMGLDGRKAFRFFVATGPTGGDVLEGGTEPLTSCLWFHPSGFPFPASRPVAIDGYDTDWRLRHGVVYDSLGDAGGGPLDLIAVKLASDRANLNLYAAFQRPPDSSVQPGLTFFLDRDADAATGLKGCDAEIRIRGAGADSAHPRGGVLLREYKADGTLRKETPLNAAVQPDFAGHGRAFLEAGIPLAALGLRPGARIRYLVRADPATAGAEGDWLRERRAFGDSAPAYRLGTEMTIDGIEDDWRSVRAAWLDPEGDAAPGQGDLSGLALASDSLRLYGKASFWNAFGGPPGSAAVPDLLLRLDTDGNAATGMRGYETEIRFLPPGPASACPQGCLKARNFDRKGGLVADRFVAADIGPLGPGSDFLEFSAPLAALGLGAAPRFRFTVAAGASPSGKDADDLQGQKTISDSWLEYPKHALDIGAVAALDSNTFREMRRDLMDGAVFRSGRHFDVRLGVHLDIFSFPWNTSLDSSGRTLYDFRDFHAKMELVKKSGLSFSPMINFHYLPTSWDFRRRHLAEFGKDPVLIDAAGKPAANFFMPFLPYCDGYGTWGRDLSLRAAKEMRPYLGDAINRLSIGNEVQYFNQDVSYDSAYTLPLWQNENPGRPIPNPANGDFRGFRSRLLADALRSWMSVPQKVFKHRLEVSTKTVPYNFTDAWYRECGYFPHIFDYFNDRPGNAIGMDAYPPDRMHYQATYRLDKPAALFEFGGGTRNTEANPDRYRLAGWLLDGARDYNLRAFFAFQLLDARDGYYLHAEQKAGIRLAIKMLTEVDPPPLRLHTVRMLLPVKPLDFPKHDNYWKAIQGLQKIAVMTQRQYPQIGVELDYGLGGTSPDLLVRTVFDSLTLPREEVFGKRNMFLISGKGSFVRFGPYEVRSTCRSPDSRSLLARGGFCTARNTVVMDWTQEWANGNRDLSTNVPSLGPDSATVLAESIGAGGARIPTIVRIGQSVFFSSDVGFSAYQSGATAKFVSDLAKKIVYGEW